MVVQLGTVTEDLNRRRYERNTGHSIKDVQPRIRHSVHKWMAATLDGLVDPDGAVFEAKFMLPWTFSEEAAAEKHMAQLQHNMWVSNASQMPGRPFCRSLRGEGSGLNSRSMPTPCISTCC
jgi:predicted phage-related endonuclease